MLRLSDAELEAVAREVHAMYHAGASRDEGLRRLRTRLSQGHWDQVPGILRSLFRRPLNKILDSMWGPEHCGPGHEIVICDEPPPV